MNYVEVQNASGPVTSTCSGYVTPIRFPFVANVDLKSLFLHQLQTDVTVVISSVLNENLRPSILKRKRNHLNIVEFGLFMASNFQIFFCFGIR